jgi:hypothetical protein
MSSPTHVDATFYAQVEPIWGWARTAADRPLTGAKAVHITQKRPERQRGGTVLVKLTIRVPRAAFLPLRPEAVVVVPEDMTLTQPIEVLAGDPA